MAYFTVNRELVDPDYHDGVVASRKEDLQFQNVVGRIKGQPVDWEQKVQVAAFPKARNAAVAEGVDFNRANVKEYTDFTLAHVMEIFRSEGYRVTRHREMLPGHNDRRGMTRAQKQALDAQNLALSVEVAALSNQEAVEYGSNKTPIMRGAFCWLKKRGNAATKEDVHAVYPIPLELVPVAGFVGDVKDAASGLTEDAFWAEAIKAKKQRGTGNMALVGMVGIDLKAHMSGWLAKQVLGGAATNLERSQPADKKILQLICDDFVRDGVRFHVLNDDHVANQITDVPFGSKANAFSTGATYAVDDYVTYNGKTYRCHKAVSPAGAWTGDTNWTLVTATWAANERSYLSGIFIDPTMWGFQTLDPIKHYNIVDEGGGPGGWHETTLRLTCLNPMGQFCVMDNAAKIA